MIKSFIKSGIMVISIIVLFTTNLICQFNENSIVLRNDDTLRIFNIETKNLLTLNLKNRIDQSYKLYPSLTEIKYCYINNGNFEIELQDALMKNDRRNSRDKIDAKFWVDSLGNTFLIRSAIYSINGMRDCLYYFKFMNNFELYAPIHTIKGYKILYDSVSNEIIKRTQFNDSIIQEINPYVLGNKVGNKQFISNGSFYLLENFDIKSFKGDTLHNYYIDSVDSEIYLKSRYEYTTNLVKFRTDIPTRVPPTISYSGDSCAFAIKQNKEYFLFIQSMESRMMRVVTLPKGINSIAKISFSADDNNLLLQINNQLKVFHLVYNLPSSKFTLLPASEDACWIFKKSIEQTE